MTTTVTPPSGMLKDDWDNITYPEPAVKYERVKDKSPVIDLGNGHKIHAQEFGNPKGEPVIVLHGGPGGGCDGVYARYFDPERYRIILFDQRGCGHSTPTQATDYAAAMNGNNTAELVKDIEAVREHFGIRSKAHILGGSWGATLGLAYSIKHPEHVKSLNLRGVFLGHQKGIKYLFQGNAANYDTSVEPLTGESTPEQVAAFLAHFNAQDASLEGGYRAFMGDGTAPGQIPAEKRGGLQHMAEGYAKAWDEFVRVIPAEKRGDMIAAYCEILEKEPATDEERAYQQRVAFAFAKWEGMISRFSHEPGKDGKINLDKFEDPEFALIFARTEAHYMKDGCYLSEDGSPTPGGSNYLLENLHRIAEHKIPISISHGVYDEVCPIRDAYELKAAYEAAGGPEVYLSANEDTGHSMVERGNTKALVDIMRKTPRMTATELSVNKHDFSRV